jgi:O-antigen ligase
MSLLVAISTYKKALVTLVVVWFLYFLMERSWSRRVIYIYLFAMAAVMGYLLVGEQVAENVSRNLELYADKSDTIARAVLIQTAFILAVKNFPFGSGLGTFASIPSVNVDYSDIYYQYGMDKVWGLGPDAADKGVLATLDCYWAHILGELGFVGSLIFLGLWFYPAFNAWFLRREPRTELERALRFFVLAMTGVMTLDGLGYYYAENPAFIIVHAGLMGLALRLLELAEAVDQEAPPDEGEKAAEAAQEGS